MISFHVKLLQPDCAACKIDIPVGSSSNVEDRAARRQIVTVILFPNDGLPAGQFGRAARFARERAR